MVKKQFQIQAYTSAPNHVKSGQGLRAFRSSLEGPFFTRSPEMKPFRTIRLQCESNHLRLTYRSCSQEKCAPPSASQTGILAWSILMMRAFVVSYMFLLYNCEQEPHVNFADLLGIPYVKVLQFVSLSNHSDMVVADCCSGKVFNKSCTVQTCNRTLQGCEAPLCGTSLDDSNSWNSKHWKVLMGFVCWISGFPKAKQGPLF